MSFFRFAIQRLNAFINKGHKRSVRAKKNILASFGIKGISLMISFVKVPIILTYLDIEKYGIWLTIASIVDWVHYFDLGIGHGLRNRFAIALALNDMEKAKRLVSTAYYYVSVLFLALSFVFIPLIIFLDWQEVLNARLVSNRELVYSVLVVYTMFIMRFVFNLITMILKADQRPAIADSFLPVGNILSLGLIYSLSFFSNDSLFLACFAISAPPVLTIFLANIVLFAKRYKDFVPRFSHIDKKLIREIFSLGIKFFIIQLAGLVMFSSSNFILTQIVNPSEVTLYNVARQYYSLPYMMFAIILAPYWSAITEAYTRNDFSWIKRSVNRLIFVSIGFSIIVLLMFMISDIAFKFWLKGRIEIPFSLSASFVVMNMFVLFFAPYSSFINGVGKLNVGLRVVVVKTLLYLPIAILLTKYYGATGLVASLILVNSLPSSFIELIQYRKIINHRAYGIWNR